MLMNHWKAAWLWSIGHFCFPPAEHMEVADALMLRIFQLIEVQHPLPCACAGHIRIDGPRKTPHLTGTQSLPAFSIPGAHRVAVMARCNF